MLVECERLSGSIFGPCRVGCLMVQVFHFSFLPSISSTWECLERSSNRMGCSIISLQPAMSLHFSTTKWLCLGNSSKACNALMGKNQFQFTPNKIEWLWVLVRYHLLLLLAWLLLQTELVMPPGGVLLDSWLLLKEQVGTDSSCVPILEPGGLDHSISWWSGHFLAGFLQKSLCKLQLI